MRQKDFAKIMNISSQCLNNYISGRRQPSLQFLKDVKNEFGLKYIEEAEAMLSNLKQYRLKKV